MAFGLRFPDFTSATPEDDAALSPAMLAFLRGQQQDAGAPAASQAGATADTPTLPAQGRTGQPRIPFGVPMSPGPGGTDDASATAAPASRNAAPFGSMADAGARGVGASSGPLASSTPSVPSTPFSLSGFPGLASTPLRRSVIDPVTGNAQLSADALAAAPDPNEVVERGLVLPIGRTRAGQTVLASQGPVHALGKAIEGLPDAPQQAADAIGYFGDVAAGRKGVFDPSTGHVSDEAMGAAGTAAGFAMTGSIPFGVPAGALRTFGGRAAATADHAALDQATVMQAAGASPESIWQGTGWGLGRDGIARFEIPDDAARLRPHDGSPNTTLGSVLDHPALFEAYPQLRDVSVFHRPELGANAAANPSRNWIAANLDDPQALPSLLHEGQHIVQRTEGFAPGASPIDPALAAHPQVAEVAALRQRLAGIDNPQAMALADRADQSARMGAYRTAAGEVEARNVEARQAMTPTERAATPPWQTQDVPAERQWLPPQSQGAAVTGDAAHMKLGAEPSLDDLLASMQSQIDEFAKTATPDRPHTLVDPSAPSWDLYHGTSAGTDFGRFSVDVPRERGKTNAAPSEAGALYLSPAPAEAAHYAGDVLTDPYAGPAGPRIIRATVDPGKTELLDIPHMVLNDQGFVDRARAAYLSDAGDTPMNRRMFDNHIERTQAGLREHADIQQQVREMGHPEQPPYVPYAYSMAGAAVQMAKERGLDTAVLRGLSESNGGDQIIALTPNRVRSYYDPDHVLYSGGPGGAGIGAGAMAAAAGYGSDAKAAPASYADRVVGAESSGNATAKNPNSSATGAGQFIDSTWLDMMRRYRPDLAGSLPKDQLLALRNDPALSREMVGHYGEENGAKLRASGLPDTDATRYLSHVTGPKGAKALLSADRSTPAAQILDPAQVAANPFMKKMTAGQLTDWAAQKVSGSAPKMTMPGGSSGPGRFSLSGPTQAPIGSSNSSGPVPASALAGLTNIDAILAQMGAGGGAGSGKGGLGLTSGSSGSSGSDGPKPPAAPAPLQRRPFGFMTFAGQTPRKGAHPKTPTRGST
jgi:hypothetical protein